MRIELIVDELVLRGVPPERADTVAAALELRLEALGERWARSGEPPAPRSEPFRRLPSVAAPATSPVALGEAVADAVWGAVGGGGR